MPGDWPTDRSNAPDLVFLVTDRDVELRPSCGVVVPVQILDERICSDPSDWRHSQHCLPRTVVEAPSLLGTALKSSFICCCFVGWSSSFIWPQLSLVTDVPVSDLQCISVFVQGEVFDAVGNHSS